MKRFPEARASRPVRVSPLVRVSRLVRGRVPRRPPVDLEKVDQKGPSPWAFLFWGVIAWWPFQDVVTGSAHPLWLAAPVLVLFVAGYAGTVLAAFDARVPMRLPVAGVVVLTALAVTATVRLGPEWFVFFPLSGLAAGTVAGHLPSASPRPEYGLLLLVGGVSTAAGLTIWLAGLRGGALQSILWGTITAGTVTAIVIRLFSVIALLREVREELAHAAVAEERLRFSRDLHDLLGHTLSLMVVKAQAVRRLAERDPARAAEQAADIEQVGRQALTEVRQAVSGYRGRGLAAELDRARTALADAGVEAVVRRSGGPLPPEPDALLGWVVREGVTNVIRHSGAGRCVITVRNEGSAASVEIADNGRAAASGGLVAEAGPVSGGNGLAGLGERVGSAGGTLKASPSPSGFVLAASVPVAAGGE
ncbi:sensor histidine kinase [Actinomadura rupiterrae]|uniref:sensor histidine kinase n=1 Tax=Actinomadura rupiterrae TaxID=559627 RepID=UPI0020A46FDF|nr:sensor histidine kinase [Actinomadura rupiterrae]MCP2335599.1 two-component system sensor histidine kinase DesK [Actinomadura rupiterrae]